MAVTEIQRARAALAAAEQAYEVTQQKAAEVKSRLAAYDATPPAKDVHGQVAIEVDRAALEAVRESTRRELSDRSALVNLRRSELETTIDRARHARAQLEYRQQHLNERRSLLVRTQAACRLVEPLRETAVWRAFPELARAADTIINTASTIQQEIGRLTPEVEQLQSNADHWGEP